MNGQTRTKNQLSSLRAMISQLEVRILAPICNCRIATSFHNAECLSAIIEAQSVPCLAHEFRTLGVFVRVLPKEPVLASDRQFCCCPPIWEPEIGDVSSTGQPPHSELRTQFALLRSYLNKPGAKCVLERPEASSLTELRTGVHARPDHDSLLLDGKRAFGVAFGYNRLREKWQKETGQTLPTWLSILRLQSAK
jgi:hypothetical protein